MVDLSKHLERMRQAIERRNYALAIQVGCECQEVDPNNLDLYKLLLDAAKRQVREGGKKGLSLGGLSLSRDPYKVLSTAVKKVVGNPDVKTLKAAGDAAGKVFENGNARAADVGLLFYEEALDSGLYNEKLIWDAAHLYFAKYRSVHDVESLDRAIATLTKIVQANPKHSEAGKVLHSWQATRSMEVQKQKKEGGAGDYRDSLRSDDDARRNEVMHRVIRTVDDAKEVLNYVNQDIKDDPRDKRAWLKRGDVLMRINHWDKARESFNKAKEIDDRDFTIDLRLGDCNMQQMREQFAKAKQAGEDTAGIQKELLEVEAREYAKRVERQPTEMGHRFHLGRALFHLGNVDEAASHFQRAVADPQHKRECHKYLGHAFAKKNLLDLATQQYTSCLSLINDELSDEYKDTLYRRARLYEQIGQDAEAKKDYTRLVEMDLSYRDAADRLSKLKQGGAQPTGGAGA